MLIILFPSPKKRKLPQLSELPRPRKTERARQRISKQRLIPFHALHQICRVQRMPADDREGSEFGVSQRP
jgi:hypothetical protein